MVASHEPGEVARRHLRLSCDGRRERGRIVVDGVEEGLDEGLREAVDEGEDEERGGEFGARYAEELA